MPRVKTADGTDVVVPDYIAGHLLHEAMSDFHNAYVQITEACYRLSTKSGGPCTDPPQGAHDKLYDGRSMGMHQFAQYAQRVVDKMQSALKRAETFATGEVYDDLIDETLLGPRQVAGNRRIVTIANQTAGHGPTTFVRERNTGMSIYASLNSWDNDDGKGMHKQPQVTITTEDMPERFAGPDGEVIMAVSINDADLYDNEGDGNRFHIERETIREILRLSGAEVDEDAIVHVQAAMNARK